MTLSSTKVLSWCPIHGDRYALTSGLCTDPNCVAKIITTFSKSWKAIARYWRRIRLAKLKEDFCIFVVEQLMKEEKKAGKKPTLNPKWLIFRMRQYLYKDARYASIAECDIPKFARTKLQQSQIYYEDLKNKLSEQGESHIIDSMINEGFAKLGKSDLPNPETVMMFTETKQFIIDKYGEPWFLFAIDAINSTDICKLTGTSLREVSIVWEQIRKQIQKEHFGIKNPE